MRDGADKKYLVMGICLPLGFLRVSPQTVGHRIRGLKEAISSGASVLLVPSLPRWDLQVTKACRLTMSSKNKKYVKMILNSLPFLFKIKLFKINEMSYYINNSVLQLQNVFFSKQFKSSITVTSDKLVITLDLLCNIYFPDQNKSEQK